MKIEGTDIRISINKGTGIMTLTPATIIVVAEAIKKGNTIRNACSMAGITQNRYNDMMRAGKQKIDKAEAACKILAEQSTDPEADQDTINAPIRAVEADLHVQFYRAVHQAEAILEDNLVQTWYDLRSTDWKAARDLLARRFPKDWAEQKTVNNRLSGPNGGPVQVTDMDLSKLSNEELERFEQLLAKVPQPRDDTDGEG